jgi:polyisoprenoid-binding protein YceI
MTTHATQGTKTFQIDTIHSQVGFAVRHLMLSKVRGHFGGVTGSVTVPDGQTIPTAVEATISVDSIDTREPQRDGHLKSPDFFHVEEHPTITFKSTHIETTGDSSFKLTGDLTIRGTTKAVTLTVDAEGRVKDPWGKDRVAFTARGRINRKDFGLTWNQALEAGGVAVGEDVDLELEIEAVAD